MLLSLHIKNYALIEDLRLEFGPGLTVLTGETGAGKSIIIESLGLILGGRSSAQAVRKGASRCFITGEFDCSKLKGLRKFLEEAGFNGSEEDTLIIRREIDASGKSRGFVNDLPASLSAIEDIGEFLVDVHGQHEHQALLAESNQRILLDSFGANEELALKVNGAWRKWKELLAKKESQGLSETERERLSELYSYQIKEIDNAKLKIGEEEEIELFLPQLKNAEKLRAAADEAHQILYGADGAVLEKLNKTLKLLENITNLGGTPGEAAESLKSAYCQAEEAAREIEHFRDGITADPDALNAMLERQDMLSRLKKKYGNSIQEILEYRQKVEAELNTVSQSDKNREALEKEIEKTYGSLMQECGKLTAARKKAAEKLSCGVEKEINELGMKKAKFTVSLDKETEPSSHGCDSVRFLFCANPGEDTKPLKSIASGGEMSRVMLGLKTVLAKADMVPVLVFDEIDAGVGGPMGRVIGKKLSGLGRHHQVLCITHLPQIAVFGSRHLSVEKTTKVGRTSTSVIELSDDARRDEIARMLSGSEITASARSHAQELLQQAEV